MRKLLFAAIAIVGLCATAEAKVVRYHSQHPIPQHDGGGFCVIGVPHVHAYAPGDPRMFRKHDDDYYFVGDPTPFGYDGPKYAYYGAHPVVDEITDDGAPEYCYLDGAHYHWYEPPAQAQFEFRGGAYWYVGTYDPSFYRGRPRYGAINRAYQPIVYARPVVDVTLAPPAFSGAVVAAPIGVHARAAVGAPVVSAGVNVYVPPPPSIHVGIGVGVEPEPMVVERHTVIVRERHWRHRRWHERRGDD